MEPGDLDLILIHEPMSKELEAELATEAKQKHLPWPEDLYYPERKFLSMIKSPLRRPGESVDMILGTSLEGVLGSRSVVAAGPRVLLWSEEARDWQAALASIRADPSEGRAQRHELLPAKRAGCSLMDMNWLTALVDEHVVEFGRLSPPSWPVELTPTTEEVLTRYTRGERYGKATRECLPLGAWWLERQGCSRLRADRGELADHDYRFRVSFGRLHPGHIAWFLRRSQATAAAHILHFKKGEPREVLEFRRGTRWDHLDEVDRIHLV